VGNEEEFETAHGFSLWLASLLNADETMSSRADDLWNELDVAKPVGNNTIVTLPSGKQFNIQVKPVSK
jgi:hypothetical protein